MSALPDRQTGNVRDLSVAELSTALKRTIEDRFGLVRVRGEISNYRGPHSSGHAYFCLKDDSARIDAVVWKTTLQRLKTRPQEGLEVVVTGRVTTFPGKSSYQIVIDSIEPAGVGALMALLDQRRKALAAEGLFGPARKRPLPFLPRVVGVVTSPTGAVVRDILHRLSDRFPRHVVVWPVRVQGETAAAEIAAAIAGFNALPPKSPASALARPDVLIVARGGGSLEDLWAFNEEVVVRAAAAGTIPLISAIGHETDTTLLDHVADLRAPTPSGAAEKAVPVQSDLLATLADIARRHRAAAVRLGERRRVDLRAVARALPAAGSVTAIPRQRLDRAEGRLGAASASGVDRRHLELSRLAHRLSQQAPRLRLTRTAQELFKLEHRLRACAERSSERRSAQLLQESRRLAGAATGVKREFARLAARGEDLGAGLARRWAATLSLRKAQVDGLGKLLDTLGYRQVLGRGFALVRDAEGRPVRSARAPSPASFLDIEFADGHIDVMTTGMARPRRSRVRARHEQGSLF